MVISKYYLNKWQHPVVFPGYKYIYISAEADYSIPVLNRALNNKATSGWPIGFCIKLTVNVSDTAVYIK